MDNQTYNKIRLTGIGPGGIHCPCCAAPNHIRKPAASRKARRRAKILLKQEIENAR